MQSRIIALSTRFEAKEYLWNEERAESTMRHETSDFPHTQFIGEFGQMSSQLQVIVGSLRQEVLENRTQLQNAESVARASYTRANAAQITYESARDEPREENAALVASVPLLARTLQPPLLKQ